MSRLPKILGFLLGAVSALCVVLALYLLATWDGNAVRRDLAREVRERCGRPLAMESAPRLRFRPMPTIVIDGLALGERGVPGIAARAGRVEAGIALLPALRGRLEVRSLAVHDLSLQLERKQGDWSLNDVLRGMRMESKSQLAVKLEALTLERARLRLHDDSLGHALTFERIHLKTGALQPGSRGRIIGEATLTEGPGAASGGLSIDVAYLLDAQGYDIESASLAFRGDAWGATGLEGELLARSGRGDHHSTLALQGLSLRAKGRIGTGRLQLNASAERLARQEDALALQAIKARMLVNDGAERTDVSFETASIAPRTASFPGEPLHAAFRSEGGKRVSSGQLSARIAYRPDHAKIELDALDARWRSSPAGSPEGEWLAHITGRANTSLLGGRVELDLGARVGKSALRMKADYEQARPIPWSFLLSGDQLDANRVRASLALEGPGDLLAPLLRLNGSGRLQLGKFSLGALHASDLAGELETGNGSASLKNARLSAFGGQFEGSVRYTRADHRLALDNRFSGIDLAAMQKALRRNWPISGTLSGQWTIEAAGLNWPDIARSLSGEARFTLSPAYWRGGSIENLLTAVRPALKDRSPAQRAALPTEQQAFTALGARCSLAAGRADCSEFFAQTPWTRLGGEGSLSLADGSLDWLTRIAVQSRGPTPRALTGLRGVTVPLRLNGPVGSAGYALDWRSAPPRPAPVKAAPRPAEPETAPDSSPENAAQTVPSAAG
ncbi:AsmA family protein [Niveibacterium sp. 24ML]|uniref:AsmA family protein n=1 Tax=Niveibacterium sp. 24ML TaxID=2985512 RepID=UPI00226E4638|nr:AsmA family protein [Niveibacterium sp. 24ML]MCX9156231.1 AsmA family protein [Niveibacterium sp. 24ML]